MVGSPMKALQAQDWPGHVRARLWTRKPPAGPHGVQLEHDHDGRPLLWVETHHKATAARWKRPLARDIPEDLTSFSLSVLGHAASRLSSQTPGAARSERRRMWMELAHKLDDSTVWTAAEIGSGGELLRGRLHLAADGGWVFVADTGEDFVGVFASPSGPRPADVVLTAVDLPPPPQ